MKKQILSKLGIIALSTTVALGTVPAYANDPSNNNVEIVNNLEPGIFKIELSDLTEAQIQQIENLIQEKFELNNKLMEKQFEFGLIDNLPEIHVNTDGINPRKIDGINENLPNVKFHTNISDGEEVTPEILEGIKISTPENIEIIEARLSEGKEVMESRLSEMREKFENLSDAQKEELYTLMEQIIDLEIKELNTFLEFGVIDNESYEARESHINERKDKLREEGFFFLNISKRIK